ncbi:condensin-2 complex subunit H2 [Rhineura floridana]|uniref:condensin-2 complex subunit H2 n=1 Tax=Rhineura floridana TaxID=261503 RepID=UPI002AC7FC6C|nr:condensin-2 complex subunit H2 [Rhineura floridana]XP_061493974.1 condensin-2 complex subunit H2 [Rhineura floridana]
MEDVEPRFMHFLQPIKDLTKNWEVDVATQLGEYLEELDQICISFDGGKTTMNFIEAALLIQGSACIYSKKVEYLYSLVYQALDFISNKKREKQPASVGEDGKDADAGNGPAEEEEEFLSLDDIQDTSRANMDLRNDQRRSTVNIVPLTPMALVPAEEAEKKDNPLFSKKGEILASRKDFRMNTCTPHANGVFMLELAGLSPTQCPPGRSCEWGCWSSMGVQGPAPAAGSTPMEVSVCATPVLALNFSGEGAGTAAPPIDENEDCDNFLPDVPEEAPDASPAGAEERVEHQTSVPQRKGYMLRERPLALDPNARIKEMLDPWRSLDPFSFSDDKPLKKGRPFAVPRGLDNLPGTKRKRRLSSKLQEFTVWFSATEHDRAGNQRSRRKGPTFTDLEVLYWKHVKERLAAQRKLQRRMQDPLLAQPFEEPEALEEDLREDGAVGDAEDGGADDFLEHEDVSPMEAPEEAPEGVRDPAEVPTSLSYEELVRKNVELFMAHSQKYARETVLSRRVQDWEEMMGPQLEEQEAHAAFDIHLYGDRVVSRLGRVGEWRSFASLVAGEPAFEVCRCMLATLQLANDYTVEISQKPGLEESVDTMALRLLTQERAHRRFHTYTAPSLAQQ